MQSYFTQYGGPRSTLYRLFKKFFLQLMGSASSGEKCFFKILISTPLGGIGILREEYS
jgi:hypothetical protein